MRVSRRSRENSNNTSATLHNLVELARKNARSLKDIRLDPRQDPDPNEGVAEPFPGDLGWQNVCTHAVTNVRRLLSRERSGSDEEVGEAIELAGQMICSAVEDDPRGLAAYAVLAERLVEVTALRPQVQLKHRHPLILWALLLGQDGESDVARNALIILIAALNEASLEGLATGPIAEDLALAHISLALQENRDGLLYHALHNGFDGLQSALGGRAVYQQFVSDIYLRILDAQGHIGELDAVAAALGRRFESPGHEYPWILTAALWK